MCLLKYNDYYLFKNMFETLIKYHKLIKYFLNNYNIFLF